MSRGVCYGAFVLPKVDSKADQRDEPRQVMGCSKHRRGYLTLGKEAFRKTNKIFCFYKFKNNSSAKRFVGKCKKESGDSVK